MKSKQGESVDFSRPFGLTIDANGILTGSTSSVRRRLSDVHDAFLEQPVSDAAGEQDPVVYEVFQRDVPPLAGELVVCTTVLQAGRVGREYFMTKGHYHSRRDRGEVYFGLRGQGLVVMQTEGEEPVEVPPLWGHRTVNTGDEPLIFLAVYPADAGHDYGAVETNGFRCRVVDEGEGPVLAFRDGPESG
jgi:glucose-6-phosphate isomerase